MLASHALLRAGRAAQPRAEAHPHDPRGALRPVPRLLPRRDRHGGRRREPAGAAAHGRCCPTARRRSAGRSRNSRLDGLVEVTGVRRRGARSRAPGPGLALRGRRRRRAARAARSSWRWPSRGCCTPDSERGRPRPAGRSSTSAGARPSRCRTVTDRGSLRRRKRCRLQSTSLPATPASRCEFPRRSADCRVRPPLPSERDRADRRDVRLRPPAAGADRHQHDDPARPRRRDHGRLRLRQDDDPAAHRRPAAPQTGRRAASAAAVGAGHVARRALRACGARSACCSSSARCSPT